MHSTHMALRRAYKVLFDSSLDNISSRTIQLLNLILSGMCKADLRYNVQKASIVINTFFNVAFIYKHLQKTSAIIPGSLKVN